jgi:hypothetical protein
VRLLRNRKALGPRYTMRGWGTHRLISKARLRSVTSAVAAAVARQGQPLRVKRNMTVAARHFLARVVSFDFRAVGVLRALSINDQKAGHGMGAQFEAELETLIS